MIQSTQIKKEIERKELLRFILIHKNVTVQIAINKRGITFKYSIWSNMLNNLMTGINNG